MKWFIKSKDKRQTHLDNNFNYVYFYVKALTF